MNKVVFTNQAKKAVEDFIEEYYKKYNLKFNILRFGTVYGYRASKENSINTIIDLAIKKKLFFIKEIKKISGSI